MTLRSTTSIKLLDLLCEGEILGLATEQGTDSKKQCIFLNDTPVQEKDSAGNVVENFNKEDVRVEIAEGTANQEIPGGMDYVSTFVDVSTEVGKNYEETTDADAKVTSRDYGGGSVSKTITDIAVTHFSCLLTIPRLFSTAVDGLAKNQLFNATICYEITANGPKGKIDSYEGRNQVTGITTSSYQISTNRVEIANRCGHPCTVTVKKLDYIYIKNETTSTGNAKSIKFENSTYEPAVLPADKSTSIKSISSEASGGRLRGQEAIFEANLYSIEDETVGNIFEQEKISLQNGRGNQLVWTSLVQHTPIQVGYDYSALAFLEISTKSFPSLPSRSYLVKGIKVQIPNNMSTRSDGSLQVTQGVDFDGTGGETVWTTCPVCIFRHLLLNKRFGAGDFINAENVSWIDLYPLIRYSNEQLLTDPLSATYSNNFNSTSGQSHPNRINITIGSGHGYVADDIINVFFMDGDLLSTPGEVVTYTVKATNTTMVAVQVRSDQQTNSSGGTCLVSRTVEPRFACNTLVASQAEAYNVLQDFASIFRGMLYYQTNGIFAAADHGELYKAGGLSSSIQPVHIYNNANVIDGRFQYEGTSVKTRSTTVKVRYNNSANLYRPDFVCIENTELREKYGHQVREIIGFGCTSKTQAARLGRWVLASEELDNDVVNFSVGLDGAVALPGQVFAVADEMRAGTRIAGRVSSATTTQVTLDANVTVPSTTATAIETGKVYIVLAVGSTNFQSFGASSSSVGVRFTATANGSSSSGTGTVIGPDPQLTCILNEGTAEVSSITVIEVVNSKTRLTVSPAFSQAPPAQGVYSIATGLVNEQKFKCIAVSDNGDSTYAIVGVEHNDSIYAVADVAGNELFEQPVSTYTSEPSSPTSLNVTFRPVQSVGNLQFQALVSWSRGATGVTIGYNVTVATGTSTRTFTGVKSEYLQLGEDLFIPQNSLLVVTVEAVGLNSVSKTVTKSAISPNAGVLQSAKFIPSEDVAITPPDIKNPSVRMVSETLAQVSFDSITNERLDQLQVVIRFSESVTSWGKTTFVNEFAATAKQMTIPYRKGVYHFKLRDIRTNAQSANATRITATDTSDTEKLLVQAMPYNPIVEAPNFTVGKQYIITETGNTFATIGGLFNTVGERFTATGTGSSGQTGKARELLDTHTIREDFQQKMTSSGNAMMPGSKFSGVKSESITVESDKLTLKRSGLNSRTQASATYTQSGNNIVITPNLGIEVGDCVNLVLKGDAKLDSLSNPYFVTAVSSTTFTVGSSTSRALGTAQEVLVSPVDTEGTYFFYNSVDMNGIYEVLLTSIITNDTNDSTKGVTDAQMYFRSSNSALSSNDIAKEGSSTDLVTLEDGGHILSEPNASDFTEWQPFTSVFATGRTFQFKVELKTEFAAIVPQISKLAVDVKLLQRVETAEKTSDASNSTNNFKKYINSFYEIPTLSAELKQASGDGDTDRLIVFPYAPLINLVPQRPGEAYYIRAVNSSNVNVERIYRYTATGFGKKFPAN